MSRPKKRIITINYDQEPNDPAELLNAIEDTFRPQSVEINVKKNPTDDSTDESSPRRVGLEPLESESRKAAEAVLQESQDASLKKRSERGIAPGVPMPESPTEIAKQRKSLMSFAAGCGKGAWQITVKAVLDWMAGK